MRCCCSCCYCCCSWLDGNYPYLSFSAVEPDRIRRRQLVVSVKAGESALPEEIESRVPATECSENWTIPTMLL